MLTIGMLFWILFIVGLVFYGVDAFRTRQFTWPSLFWWTLLFLLGWSEFGFPISGK